MIVGGDGPDVEVHSMTEGKLLTKFKAHDKRVKAGSVIAVGKVPFLVTASNDGFVKLWKVSVSITSNFFMYPKSQHVSS